MKKSLVMFLCVVSTIGLIGCAGVSPDTANDPDAVHIQTVEETGIVFKANDDYFYSKSKETYWVPFSEIEEQALQTMDETLNDYEFALIEGSIYHETGGIDGRDIRKLEGLNSIEPLTIEELREKESFEDFEPVDNAWINYIGFYKDYVLFQPEYDKEIILIEDSEEIKRFKTLDELTEYIK